MANKKNKKNSATKTKKVVNKLSKESQAVEIAYENNLERISVRNWRKLDNARNTATCR